MIACVTPVAMIQQMERLLSSRGVKVSARPIQSSNGIAGGLVKLKGRPLVVIDSSAPQVEQLMVLAEVLCSLDFELALLPTDVRRIVVKARAKRRWRLARLTGRARDHRRSWTQLRLVTFGPGLRACKDHDAKPSR
jgi:hypothetical protein